MLKSFKTIALLLVTACSTPTFALTSYWEHGFGQGYDIYAIDIDQRKKISLHISCGEGANDENSVYITKNNKTLKTSVKNKFEFIINERVYPIPASTDYTNVATPWVEFIEAIQQSTQFDVYVDGRLFLNAKPSTKNVAQAFYGIECRPKTTWD